MRLPHLILLVFLIINVAVDGYLWLCLRSYFRKKIYSQIQVISAIFFNLGFLILILWPLRNTTTQWIQIMMWTLYAYLSVYISKYVFIFWDILSRIPLIFKRSRASWVSTIGTIIALCVFLLMWWGDLFNRFNIDVKTVIVPCKQLPKGLNGLTIVQISDLHTGTFGNDTTFVHKLVEEVNALKPDIIVFTGDVVNTSTSELRPFVKPLSRLHAKYGVYSVLGNHDYGDYRDWPNENAKKANLEEMCALQKKMGWNLLNNESSQIVINSDTLCLIGVENIGDPPFHCYGNLGKAYKSINDNSFKILLSHNPSHWDKDIANNPDANIALTLSGHTHAMQMEFLGISPAAFRYPHWGGLYADDFGKHLYVNIGAGTVGFPARIGATPEISLITLEK